MNTSIAIPSNACFTAYVMNSPWSMLCSPVPLTPTNMQTASRVASTNQAFQGGIWHYTPPSTGESKFRPTSCMYRSGNMISETARLYTVHPQPRSITSVGCTNMQAYHGFVCPQVCTESPWVWNRNKRVSVAPQLNDTFSHKPHHMV